MNQKELSTVNKLMLLQGISLIENGLQFLDWLNKYPNENYLDSLSILRDRFQFFKYSALEDENLDSLFIDRSKTTIENVNNGYELRKEIENQLKKLREVSFNENEERKKTANN